MNQPMRTSSKFPTEGWLSTSSDRAAVGILLLVFFAAVALIGPGGDYPLNDDWAYAYTARTLMKTGRIHILDWTAPSLVAHAAWGAAVLMLWDSFIALRIGTLAFAVLGLLSLYGIGRRAGLPAMRALLPAIALCISPWYLNLSLSYMTDVPWLAVVLCALLCCAHAMPIEPGSPPHAGWLLVGGLLLTVAALIRQFALILVPGCLPVFFWMAQQAASPGEPRRRAWWRGVLWSAPLWVFPALGYRLFHLWYTRVHGATIAHEVTWRLMAGIRPWHVTLHALIIAFYLGLSLWPLWISVRPSRLPVPRRVSLFVHLCALAVIVTLPALGLIKWRVFWEPNAMMHPLMPYLGNLIHSLSIGPQTLSDTFSGLAPPLHDSLAPGILMTALAYCGVAGMAGALGLLYRTLWRRFVRPHWRGADDATRPVDALATGLDARVLALLAGAGTAYLLWLICLSFVLFDRYVLPLLPLGWLLAMAAYQRHKLRHVALICGFLPYFTFSVLGMREYLGWNSARDQAVHDLIADGISPQIIDAGMEWNATFRFTNVHASDPLQAMSGAWLDGCRYHLSFWPPAQSSLLRGCTEIIRYPFEGWPFTGPHAIHVVECQTPYKQ